MSSKHGQLANTLRTRITAGRYGPSEDLPDGKLPSEAELENETGYSRTTVRAALKTLQHEGLIRSESGVGSFVREVVHLQYRPQDDFKRDSTVPESAHLTGAVLETQVELGAPEITVAIEPAETEIARRLGVDENTLVVTRKRRTFLKGEPYRLNDSYYPRDVAEGTAAMEQRDIPEGINSALAARGFVQVRALDEIWVRMPKPEEVARLQLSPGVPVAVHRVTGIDADNRPLRTVCTVLPGDRSVITFDRSHPEHG